MAAICYYGNVMSTTRWRLCVFYIFNSSVIDWTCYMFFFHVATAPSGPEFFHCRGFAIALRHTTLSRTPLEEWSARRRDLYMTRHNNYKIYPFLRWDSNLQSQVASGLRPTPQTAQPLGSAELMVLVVNANSMDPWFKFRNTTLNLPGTRVASCQSRAVFSYREIVLCWTCWRKIDDSVKYGDISVAKPMHARI